MHQNAGTQHLLKIQSFNHVKHPFSNEHDKFRMPSKKGLPQTGEEVK